MTDTNQASEDIDNILFEAIESAGSYIHKLTAAEADYIQEQAKEAILAIIRTEKLKLLAEVRERVVGEDDEQSLRELSRDMPYEEARDLFEVNTTRNVLKDEQRTALTAMEAGL